MKKVTKLVLMLCLSLSAAFCYAHGVARTENEKGKDGVKKSIDITASIEPVYVGNTDNVTFRATDAFEITGPFQVNSGGGMTVIMQTCPD